MASTTTTQVTRTVGKREVPLAGTYEIDPAHSSIEFIARHLMISKVRGNFRQFSGTIDVGEQPEDSKVAVDIDASSIDTGDETRDQHLRSDDFFGVEQFPAISFRSAGVAPKGDDWVVTGDLTIRGVTQPVELHATFGGAGEDPWGNTRFGITATGEIDRERWGLTWNQALEAGGVLVSKRITLDLNASAVRK